MPLFLMGCFAGDFQEGERPMKAFGENPLRLENGPSIDAHGQFSGTPPWWKAAPLKRPIKGSMISQIVLSVGNFLTTMVFWGLPDISRISKSWAKSPQSLSKMVLQKCNVNFAVQIVNSLRVNFRGGSFHWKI